MILVYFQLNRILRLILKGLNIKFNVAFFISKFVFFATVYFFCDRVFEKHTAGFPSKTFG